MTVELLELVQAIRSEARRLDVPVSELMDEVQRVVDLPLYLAEAPAGARKRVALKMLERGLTPRTVADQLGYSENYVKRLASARR